MTNGAADLNRWLVPLLLGACALSTAYTAGRLVAPFYGSGPLLASASLVISFLSLGVGLLLDAWRGEQRRGGDAAPGTRSAAWLLLLAAAWTIAVPWARARLLVALEPAGLRTASVLAMALFAGVPLAALGSTLGRCGSGDERPNGSRATLPFAAATLGAALAAPFVVWMLVPLLGLSRTLLATGAVEAVAAALLGAGRRRMARRVSAAALIAAAAVSAARWPAIERDPAHGLVEACDGADAPYRVVDRVDGRFLLADGGIQTMVSGDTRDVLERPAAVFQILNRLISHPDSLLVLGLRGGGVAKQFAREGWRVRVVEPDPMAARVATELLSFHATEVRLTIADARRFCRTTSGRYAAVIFDAFDRGSIPPHLITRECLASVADRVAPNGVLALAIVTRGWNDPVIVSLAAMLGERFHSVFALPTSEPPNALGSIVLLASNGSLDLPDERLPQPTDFLMNPDEHWAVVQMNHAWFNRFAPLTRGAVILTDDRNPIDVWSDPVQHAARVDLHRSFATPPKSW